MDETTVAMGLVSAEALARLLPVAPNEVVFQYLIGFDTAWSPTTTPQRGAVKVDMDKLPFQFPIVNFTTHSPPRRHVYGFNVFKEGVNVRYQAFMWKGEDGLPPAERLTEDSGKCDVGSVPNLDPDAPTESAVDSAAWPSLYSHVQPIFSSFPLELFSSSLDTNPLLLTPEMAKTTQFTNSESSRVVSYQPSVTYTYSNTASTSVTDEHTFEIGREVAGHWSWVTGISEFQNVTFGVDIALNYTNSTTHSATSTWEETFEYSIAENLQFDLDPGTNAYVSLLLSADRNAMATLTLNLRIEGSVNGTPLTGEYLKALAEAQGPTVEYSIGDDFFVYQLSSEVQANLVSNTLINVSDTIPSEASARELLGL